MRGATRCPAALATSSSARTSSIGRRCLLADPRHALEEDLPVIAAELGLHWREERRPGDYTLAVLTAMEMRVA